MLLWCRQAFKPMRTQLEEICTQAARRGRLTCHVSRRLSSHALTTSLRELMAFDLALGTNVLVGLDVALHTILSWMETEPVETHQTHHENISLCEKCSNIRFTEIRELDISRTSTSVFYFHHASKEALFTSAQHGCHFCAMLWQRLFRTLPGFQANTSRADQTVKTVIFRKLTFPEQWADPDKFVSWNRNDCIYISCEDQEVIADCVKEISGA